MTGYSACEMPLAAFGYMLVRLLRSAAERIRFLFAEREIAAEKEQREAANRRAKEILGKYGNSILRYAYTYLHNMSDAEEVLQDTILKCIRTAPVFENERHEKSWLLRVAGNISKNRIEYNALRKTDELNDELVSEEREDLSFVWEAVKSLPANYREAVHLFYHEGYSTKQIAEILGKNEATVRSDLHRGREKLKILLREECDFEETV